MQKSKLEEALQTAGINAFRYFDCIGSTNDEAISWVDAGAADYSLVVADDQTRGKGRFKRRWVTVPGVSLAFSLILKPTHLEVAKLPFFAPLCGLAVRDALEILFHLQPEIKWPNDILLERKKCCGILVEAAWSAGQVDGIVLGIGINISPASIPPAEMQLFAATCLQDHAQQKVDRYQVLAEVLQQIHRWRPLLGSAAFFEHWQNSLAFKNEQVMIVQSEKQSIIGVEKGIDEQGNLVLILTNQEEMAFEAGDVHLRPAAVSSKTGGKHA